MYTSNYPLKHPCIHPFTPIWDRKNLTCLFIGNYLKRREWPSACNFWVNPSLWLEN
jgi:hypothetical protein